MNEDEQGERGRDGGQFVCLRVGSMEFSNARIGREGSSVGFEAGMFLQ